MQFAVQTIINMASNITLMPPKGMTLPFVSYGGSSTLALAKPWQVIAFEVLVLRIGKYSTTSPTHALRQNNVQICKLTKMLTLIFKT